jgi:hypothetical protein
VAAVVAQYISRPQPGSDLASIVGIAKEAAALWRKHGGEVSYWSIVGGEIGNMAFAVRFESFEAYGKTLSALFADPDYQAWQAKRMKAGQADWVRANLATELAI